MNSIVNYILESGVSLSFLALIYVFFLRKETFFRANRLFLLGSVLFSVVLPLIKLRILSPQSVLLEEITVTPYQNLLGAVTIYSQDFSGSIEQIILSTQSLIIVYIIGLVFFLARFMYRIFQLVRIIRRNPIQKFDGFKMVVLNDNASPFSFLDYVFVNNSLKQKEGYDRMIAHELEHVKQGHTFDVLILELLSIFQWFNPFMWMLRHAIRENHEYLADQAVLTAGVSRGYYKQLLLSQFVGDQLVVTNNFNYSLIKNRIKMMSKIKSSKLALTKISIGALVAVALVVVFACEQKETMEAEPVAKLDNTEVTSIRMSIEGDKIKIEGSDSDYKKLEEILSQGGSLEIEKDSHGNIYLAKNKSAVSKKINREEVIYNIVDVMPVFPGGDKALRQFIANSVKYPELAQEKGIQGKVYVTFVVAKDGLVANCEIARGVDPILDKEALRVVSSLPKWQPGKINGKAVNVQFTVPINFKLK